MRNLDEYKAEIFRRSEVKQAKIKRNKRIISTVLPLCVCVAALVTMIVPQFMNVSDDIAHGSAENTEVVIYQSVGINSSYFYEYVTSVPQKGQGIIADNGSENNGAAFEGSYYIEFNRAEISDGKNAESTTDIEKVRELKVALMGYIGADSRYEFEEYAQGSLFGEQYELKVTLYSKQNITWTYIIEGNSLVLLTPSGEYKVTLSEAETYKLIASIRS